MASSTLRDLIDDVRPPVDLAERFERLKSYVGWSADDVSRLISLRRLLQPGFTLFVDDFYSELLKHPEAAHVITGGEAQIARLKQSLHVWLLDLLTGPYDQAYTARRWRVGYRHVQIGLDQTFVSIALGRLRWQMCEHLAAACRQDPSLCYSDLTTTLHKLLDLDQVLLQSAYDAEFQARQRPVNAARLLQQRWLTEISGRALQGSALEDLFEGALEAVSESLKPQYVALFRPTANPKVWEATAQTLWPDGARQLSAEPNTWLGCALAESHPLVQEDLRLDARFQLPKPIIEAGLISGAIAAIDDDHGRYAALVLGFRGRIQLAETDRDFLSSIGNLLTTAVQRAIQIERQQASERRLRRLIDRLPAGAVYVLEDRIYINAAVEEMTGYARHELETIDQWRQISQSEAVAESAMLISPSEQQDGAVTRSREKLRRRDATERMIDVVAFRSDSDEVWLLQDMTDADRQRQKALQSERLALIGQMITTLAHEARNALQRICASTETLELELEDRPELACHLQRLGVAQDDLKRLFDEVRNYAAPVSLVREELSLSELAQSAWDSVVGSRSGRQVTFNVRCETEDTVGLFDRFRLEQVFRNLYENSLAASRDPLKIDVTIESLVSEASTESIREDGSVEGKPGDWWSVRYRDSGPGIKEEVRKRVFEPFFTTKAKGTGLGMAIAERIIVAHGGKIEVLSPAQGAEFRILLPRVANVTPTSNHPGG